MNDEARYPCVYEMCSPPGKVQMAGPLFDNVDDTNHQMSFRLPLPARKGHLRLHVNGCQIGVLDADPANYVSQLSVNGMTYAAMNVLFESKDPVNAQQLKPYSFGAHDASNFESVCVRVWCTVSAPHDLNISSVSLHCYYA